MQRFTSIHLLRSLACAVLLAPAGIVATAAELGDVSARSYIGQPLSADIELVALAPDEVNALQVRLARPDVFRGANITMNPALSSVRMSVVKRDQKQFLHVTTTRAIDADYVHMYVELSAAGRQDVRLATVWLQADPNPPPPPAPVTASVAAPSAMTSGDAERTAAQARAERVAASPAVPAAPPVRDRSRPAPLPSLHESETGVPGALKAAAAAATPPRQTPTVAVRDLPSRIAEAMGTPRSAPATAPAPASMSTSTSAPASSPTSAKQAAKRDAAAADGAVPLPVAQALLPLGPLPLPAGVKRPAAPASCAPSGISAKECKVLDTHSQALSSKLVELEGKMKALQGAIKNSAATPAATPAAAPAAAAPAAAPKVGQAATAVLAAAGSSVAAAVAAPASAKEAPKSASVASAAPGPEAASTRAAEDKPGKSSKPGKAGEAQAATMDGASASASAGAASASASASAGEHGANASASAAGASASASAPVPLKRVLPKLKYKKEKPVERPTNYVAWGAGAVGALLLAGAGLIYWRRKKSGAAPLKIWQGFRKKKPAEAAGKPQEAQPLHEVTPESIMQ